MGRCKIQVTNCILKKSKIKKCGLTQDKNGNIITASEQKAGYFNDNVALNLMIKISQRSFAQRFDDSMSSFSSEKSNLTA